MNSRIHLIIATTLSMTMTFVLYCSLKCTRATGYIFQTILIDRTRDSLLYFRCLSRSETINKERCEYLFPDNENKVIYQSILIVIFLVTMVILFGQNKIMSNMRPLMYTIIAVWFLARFCDGFHLEYNIDILTIYIFVWQLIFIMTKWEFRQYPILSINLYRGWLCLLMSCHAFIVYDSILSYLPSPSSFIFFWLFSIKDIFICLYLEESVYSSTTINETSNDVQAESITDNAIVPAEFYATWDVDNDEVDENGDDASLGLADFLIYNLMLLSILPPLSSMKIKICVAIGHIIAVQIGQEVTYRLGRLFNQCTKPALPLPVMMVSFYTLLLKNFLNY